MNEGNRRTPKKAVGAIPTTQIPPLAFAEAVSRMMAPYQAVLESVERFRRSFEIPFEPFTRMAQETKKCERLEAAGWLAHSSSPHALLRDDSLSAEELDQAVERHYRENWVVISKALAGRIEGYDIDDEAKATVREALAAHGNGLYRCSPRLLYPEIERVSRVELHGGSFQTITSQRELQDRLGNLSPGDLSSWGMAGLRFYDQLREHLYAHLHQEDARVRVFSSPVPNRHAALHGFTTYSSFKSSINALIVADFMLGAIATLKAAEPQAA